MREKWATVSNPKKIIQDLTRYQDVFLDLHYGTNLTCCPNEVGKVIHCLSRMEAPSSVYPFVMHTVAAVKEGQLDAAVAVEILKRVESFLARRVVCGYEPTGLHAVFKSLWDDCEGEYSVEKVVQCIKQHTTVKWPDDNEFRNNIIERQLYRVRITPFILAEWNGHLGGDIPEFIPQIEHILPENPEPTSQWVFDWSKEEREAKKDCLANLLPLSGAINSSIQNADYAQKRQRYIDDSALKAPREFGQNYSVWTPVEFNKRAKELATWALSRWPY